MEQPELTAAFATQTLKPIMDELGVTSGCLGIDHASFSLIEAVRAALPNVEHVIGRHLRSGGRHRLAEELCQRLVAARATEDRLPRVLVAVMPDIAIMPPASITSASPAFSCGATASMRPSSSSRSPDRRRPIAGS